ncbi:MAG TPA: putative O-glycosylation ligase, exosortase A system-associated [Chromatiaceae bacterium]|jgi:probable O-glycosylation ligase (exosortase A-associated)|nr:putative O-glycosylation ligase, exosortase A system-associated [Chromatiaceae bacterium]HIN81789.1 putative O-glycosylation ligase, exosortase A system-associated [Chromatiales bacterium]HIO02573.1 putative O-glycosylation ligase, exosortase A system-associated [Alphaproteobacteria bacterium]HIA08920.1 putative O-glycosylation ligase, exosortase A system-associated [Chromatiaceae bacterium]HIB84545.1 putative O-glycosylation ligase, exosortase A system-associated [Chromatiaceae bacterium]
MRDAVVLAFLIGCVVMTIKRPWWGVLCLAIFSYMNPHAYAWGFVRTLPVYQTLFIVAVLVFFTTKDKQRLPKDWRVTTFYCLWAYFFFTTLTAENQFWAWPKLLEVSKIYAPFFLTLMLINTREKLYYLIITIAASIGLLGAKAGIWAIGSGFAYRVYGPEGTQFYENNAFAIAVLMVLPLIVLWIRETADWRIRYACMAAIPLCICSVISSWSRGALLCLGVVGFLLLWHSSRKWLILPIAIAGVVYSVEFLPEEWFARMYTLGTYGEDASALGRLQAWADGWRYVLKHPFTGAGFDGWRYVTFRDWHSSYVEMLAEHGFIAFAMWLSLMLGSIISLTRLPGLVAHRPDMAWVKNYSYMVRASLVAYMVGTLFLGLAYWDIFYHMVFISVLIKKFALEQLAEEPDPAFRREAKDKNYAEQFDHSASPHSY